MNNKIMNKLVVDVIVIDKYICVCVFIQTQYI